MKSFRFLIFLICVSVFAGVFTAPAAIEHIEAVADQLIISGRAETNVIGMAELQPYDTGTNLLFAPQVAQLKPGRKFKVKVPRWDGVRDRLYSGFTLFSETNGTNVANGEIHFVETLRKIASHDAPFPKSKGKKGLQVQMLDDAIALGVKNAALNVDLGAVIDFKTNGNSFTWQLDGQTYYFRHGVVADLDHRVKSLSDAGMVITLILLDYKSGDPVRDAIMLHPKLSKDAPHALSAFNTGTPEGLRYYKAVIEFLADRYSQPGYPHGRAVNFIVGNEVNAHWYWSNMGEVPMPVFADDYLRAVRICNTAVHKVNANARVYISLEHHWNIRIDTPVRSFTAHEFLDYFNRRAIAQGNFNWNLAFHPYPEDLNEPRTWNDKTATLSNNTPRITFKNIQMLPAFFKRTELLYDGQPRHIILSEQGFNTPKKPEGELWQAAGYCYAWYKINRLDGIDSFILHRHVDFLHEDGLSLGLWARKEDSKAESEPGRKKKIYEVFRLADTPEWRQAFAFALPIIGIKRWEDISLAVPPDASR